MKGVRVLQSLVVLSFLTYGVITSPTNKGYKVNQVLSGQRIRKGAKALAHGYMKYGNIPPDHVLVAAAAQEKVTGSVIATPGKGDNEYLCPVTVGPVTLNLNFDTGSSDFWVFSSKLPEDDKKGHRVVPCDRPKLAGETWDTTYGDGSGASGDIETNRVVVGGVTHTSVATECATSVSPSFADDKASDGLIGLSFGFINTAKPKQIPTYFDSIKNLLPLPLFTVTLRHNKPGSYDFGYINKTAYTGDINYTPVDNSTGYWITTAQGYSVGDGPKTLKYIKIVPDTGTSSILLPPDVVKAYYAQIAGSSYSETYGGYIFPKSSSVPDFKLYYNDLPVILPAEFIKYGLVTQTTYYGGMQPGADEGQYLLGDVFFKNLFVIFEPERPRIGFAKQVR